MNKRKKQEYILLSLGRIAMGPTLLLHLRTLFFFCFFLYSYKLRFNCSRCWIACHLAFKMRMRGIITTQLAENGVRSANERATNAGCCNVGRCGCRNGGRVAFRCCTLYCCRCKALQRNFRCWKQIKSRYAQASAEKCLTTIESVHVVVVSTTLVGMRRWLPLKRFLLIHFKSTHFSAYAPHEIKLAHSPFAIFIYTFFVVFGL